MTTTKQNYSRWSKYYQDDKDFSLITRASLAFILDKTKTNKKTFAIDLGSGTGQLSRELFHRGFQKVAGVDISDIGVKLAREATILPELTYFQYNLEEDFTSLFPTRADFIICKYVFAFIDDKPTFLDRVRALLNDNSPFIVINPSRIHLPEGKTGITTDPQETQVLLARYFDTVSYYEYARDDIFVCT